MSLEWCGTVSRRSMPEHRLKHEMQEIKRLVRTGVLLRHLHPIELSQ
jgi:hypothetical protein